MGGRGLESGLKGVGPMGSVISGVVSMDLCQNNDRPKGSKEMPILGRYLAGRPEMLKKYPGS